MNTVLDDAEQRIAPDATTAQTVRQEHRDAMRQEIGRPHYEQAKVQLPKLEAFIAKEIIPFLARVSSIGQRAKKPLPQRIQALCNEMMTLCDSVPNRIRAGIDGWERLSPPIGPDGRLDPNERARLIYHIRASLRNWDGVQSRLAELKIFVEQHIEQSKWPAGQPGAGAAA